MFLMILDSVMRFAAEYNEHFSSARPLPSMWRLRRREGREHSDQARL